MDFESIAVNRISHGGLWVNGELLNYNEYTTDNEKVRVLAMEMPDGRIYETYYDPYKEQAKKALERITPTG